MSSKRVDRINELLQREIANGLYSLQTSPPLDLARITVAGVETNPDLRSAVVRISVLEDAEGRTDLTTVVRTLNRKRKDLQKMISNNIILKYTPLLQFVEDKGQAHADRIYQILDSLPPYTEDTPSDGEDSSNGPART
jgi:ribosome-binding factor A